MSIIKIPANKSNYGDGRSVKAVKYVVIHYTANNGDTAKGNGKYFAGNKVGASAHYFVDDKDIVQSVEDNYTAWHCGGKKYYSPCRNETSIGVELCSRRDEEGNYYFSEATINNAVVITKNIMSKYNIPPERVIRHYDVTHKICPAPFVNNTKLWQNFKKRLEVKAMVNNYDDAMNVLTAKGVVATREYWDVAVKVVKHLDALIINMANKLD